MNINLTLPLKRLRFIFFFNVDDEYNIMSYNYHISLYDQVILKKYYWEYKDLSKFLKETIK